MSYPHVSLKDVGKISTGNTPSKKNEEYYTNGTIPFVKPNLFSKDFITDISKADEFLSTEGAKRARSVGKQSVLVTCIGIIGNIGITAGEVCFNQQINAIEPYRGKGDPKFIAYALMRYKAQLQDMANAPVVPIINKTQFSEFKIPLPTLSTQKKIVDILDRAQRLIDLRKEQIKEMDTLVQALFYDMFGDPVVNPKGWEVRKLKYASDLIQIGPFGSLLHKEDYIQGGIPLINPMHIKAGKVSPDRLFTVSDEKIKELQLYILKAGDVIMGRRGEMGRCAVINDIESGYLCGTGSLFIRPNVNLLNSEFLYSILSSPQTKDQLESFSLGATMPNLNKTIMQNLEIIVPPMPMQNQYTASISTMGVQKAAMTESLVELENNFNGLMQRAFRGELV